MQLFIRHTNSVSNICKGTISADNDPFPSVEAYHAEARFYKMKDIEVANDEDILVTFPIRHPLAGFPRPLTSLECETVNTYHSFEVPNKGDVK